MYVKCPECGNEFFQEKIDEGSLKYVYCEKCETFIDFCGKCDEMLISKIEGMCAGQYCLKCKEWVIVTSYIPPKNQLLLSIQQIGFVYRPKSFYCS